MMNASDKDSVDRVPMGDLDAWNRDEAYKLIPIDVLLVLYALIGVFGNIAVIYIYSFKLKVKFDDKFFILVLAGMDIIVCSTGPLFSLARNLLPVNFQGDVLCRVCWYFVRTMGTASGMLLFIIAVQRYLKVCRPFGRQMTSFINKVALAVTFGVAIMIDIPIFVFYGETEIYVSHLNVTGYRCGRKDDESPSMKQDILIYFYFMFVCAGSVMMGVAVLYSMTGYTIYKQVKKHMDLTVDAYNASTHRSGQDTSKADANNSCISLREITLTDSPEVTSKRGNYKSIRNSNGVDDSPAIKKSYKHNLVSYEKNVAIESEESSSSKTTGSVERSDKVNEKGETTSIDRGYSTDDACGSSDTPKPTEEPRNTCDGIKEQVGTTQPTNSHSKTVSFTKIDVETLRDDDEDSGNDSGAITKTNLETIKDEDDNSSYNRASNKNISFKDASPGGSPITKGPKQESHIGNRWKKNRMMVHRFSIMFMMIAVVCTITYTPALIANVLVNLDSVQYWTEYAQWERILYLFLFQLYLLNHVANPFIYAFFDKTFRKEFKNMLKCKRR
ncbi:muscarinic acetylcholine receptor M3-like [Mizuhopecten yessoensis]|uniref:Cholecystokinin receptor n=1 Tax=Mizuhopecten yessoensis TaxID=6573 RepID=A0A210QEA6_MIZYE|nr:muscarinic acetylcholine receptor M3-like [Mizuhopecten yessoensis]OWF47097.1 Cholecystokinin receptor [Mizuhopecten yessoensis]